MIQTRTLVYACNQEELEAIGTALDFIRRGDIDAAARVLIARHDVLTAAPQTKLYDQRDAA